MERSRGKPADQGGHAGLPSQQSSESSLAGVPYTGERNTSLTQSGPVPGVLPSPVEASAAKKSQKKEAVVFQPGSAQTADTSSSQDTAHPTNPREPEATAAPVSHMASTKGFARLKKGGEFRASPYKETLAHVNTVEPIAEHTVPHQGILMHAIHNKVVPRQVGLSVDNGMTIAIAEELVAKGIGPIGLLNPWNSPDFNDWLELLLQPGTDVAEAYQKESISFPGFNAADDSQQYLRDVVLMGQQEDGTPVTVTPVLSDLKKTTTTTLLSNFAHFFKSGTGVTHFYFEGGNVKGGERQTYTLSDTVKETKLLYDEFITPCSAEAARDLVTHGLSFQGRRPVVILDEGYQSGKEEQPIFHLDLAMGLTKGPDGVERAVLASLDKTKEVLEAEGLGGYMDADKQWTKRWQERNFDPEHFNQMRRQHLRAMEQFIANNKIPKKTAATMWTNSQTLFDKLYGGMRQQALRQAGKALPVVLAPEHYGVIQPYLGHIKDNLKANGFTDDTIIEVPALLYPSELLEIPEFTQSALPGFATTYRYPYYSPACGFQYNPVGASSSFLTGGGIRMFDDYAKQEIERRTGLPVVPIQSMLLSGFAGAGFDCYAIPIQQNALSASGK